MSDAEIATEIESLRARFPETRELYREVCALLFFRYGITPTANRLYQYVRKGSMATPAQVLSKFWTDLRERTRIRIDHPDLPDALRETAGEMTARLWAQAQQEAARGFEHQSAQAESRVDAMRAKLRETEDALADREARIAALGPELAESRAQVLDLGRQLATIQGRLASMTEMLRDQGDEMRELRGELSASRRDAARAVGEANAVRVQLALAKRRGSRKPIGGVGTEHETGQEDLELERPLPANDDPREDPRND
ncbi:MAG: DNA-binding protein [Burkholderiaceae bacterium]|nr:DNA-binding protein [Burkholderiaceae bacterium]